MRVSLVCGLEVRGLGEREGEDEWRGTEKNEWPVQVRVFWTFLLVGTTCEGS